MRSLILFLILAANTLAHSSPYGAYSRVNFGPTGTYLVQEPKGGAKSARAILVYAHGGGGQEEQGMDPKHYAQSFHRLRLLLHLRNFIYVCPRFVSFKRLYPHLRKRYGQLPIYLAGASAGGATVFRELLQKKRKYGGAILLCPALSPKNTPIKLPSKLPPLYIVSGEDDVYITQFCRQMIAQVKKGNHGPYKYVELPQGNHDAPLKKAPWSKALSYLQAHTP